MSLQGPIVVVAEHPAVDLVAALSAAGAFPIIETNWTDAPASFVSVKPCAVIIAEPGPPPSDASARMLCLQIATTTGPVTPVIALTSSDLDAAIPIAIAVDQAQPVERLIARLRAALRVRALHSSVLRRVETSGSGRGTLPTLPVGDPLDDATVMIVGRGPLYPALSVAMGERVGLIGALTVETAMRHLEAREINGIVVGDGFTPRIIEGMLTALLEQTRFRAIPVSVIGDLPADLAGSLPQVDRVEPNVPRIVARMLPAIRLHALEARFKRMVDALDSEGMFDAETGLLSLDAFWDELNASTGEAFDRGNAFSVGRFTFAGRLPPRAANDAARLVTRLTRESDFACRDDDGAILIGFGNTDLHDAHPIARRIASVLKNSMRATDGAVDANVTLATLKADDTLDSLLTRVYGGEVVAAE
jgi:hypothetical protein